MDCTDAYSSMIHFGFAKNERALLCDGGQIKSLDLITPGKIGWIDFDASRKCGNGFKEEYYSTYASSPLHIEVYFVQGSVGFILNDKDCGLAFHNISASFIFFVEFKNIEGTLSLVKVKIFLIFISGFSIV